MALNHLISKSFRLQRQSAPHLPGVARRFLSMTPSRDAGMDRIGLGGFKWQSPGYLDIVKAALRNGITTIEAGHEGGEKALAEILEEELPLLPPDRPIQCLIRVGYRATISSDSMEATPPGEEIYGAHFEEDLVVEKNKVVHNIGPNYAEYVIRNDSPLTELAEKYPDRLQIIALLHNPEEQKGHSDHMDNVQSQLSASFAKLQEMVDHGPLLSYGVVSNGFGLPADHPLHLSWKNHVWPALHDSTTPGFRVLQFPYNLLETNSLPSDILKQRKDEPDSTVLQNLQLYAMRPLTCYPNRGTGSGHPFLLRDYKLPATMDKNDEMQWTHEMKGPPAAYESALKAAIGHFDAHDLLELKTSGTPLDADQRETLDGCKLMQSLLHDVDHGLTKVRSFAAHEQFLMQDVIPLIHDTFESYDEDTGRVLEMFFGAYTLAVKHAIARNVRTLLVKGEQGETPPVVPDLPPNTRLQEYALRHVWDHEGIDKIVMGASKPDYVDDIHDIVRTFAQEDTKQPEKDEASKSSSAPSE